MIIQWESSTVGIYAANWEGHELLLRWEHSKGHSRPSWHLYVDGAPTKHSEWRSLQGAWNDVDAVIWKMIRARSAAAQQRAMSGGEAHEPLAKSL